MELKDKVMLVTGASRGIGKNLSTMLADRGANVIMTARNERLLSETVTQIISSGGNAKYIVADLANDGDIFHLFSQIKKIYGRLDVLVNNAAIGVFGKLVDFSMDDFDRIMRVNLRAVYLCCQQALKFMIAAKGGHIINISSVVGIKGYPNQTAYTASKHGIMGLTKALAAEVQEHGICVSVILPGGVDTDFATAARPDLDRSILIPPSDISKTVMYILELSANSMVDEIYIRRRTNRPF